MNFYLYMERLKYYLVGELKTITLNRIIMTIKINPGDTITFFTCCNADRKEFTAVVQTHVGLGLVCNVDGVNYEIRKMIDINIVSELN